MIDAATIRTATWKELPVTCGYTFWKAPEVPGIARVAHNGSLYWRFGRADHHDIEELVEAYNAHVQAREIPEEAVRAALAAQLGVDLTAIPENPALLAGMRRALEAYIRISA